MNWEGALIVARKELREIALNRGSWISALFLAFFFAFTNMATIAAQGEQGAVVLDGPLVYLSMFIGVFTGFLLAGAVFYREKQSGVIETLLCTPLNLRTIWTGKVIGVAVPAYLMALAAVGAMVLFTLNSGAVVAPVQPFTILHIALAAPLFAAAAIGLVGYVQLALGMRENRFINFGVFALLILGLTFTSSLVSTNLALLEAVVMGVLAASAGLLVLAYLLSSRLRKEKIITTIPD